MTKKISFLMAIVLIISILPVNAMAAEISHEDSEVRKLNLSVDQNEYEIEPQTDGYYYWAVESKTNQGTVYGSWRLGPQGDGPGTISVNKTDTVTNTSSNIPFFFFRYCIGRN